jgi:hypothetical protein
VAKRQIRKGCTCGLTKPSAKRATRSAGILSFITAEERIRALTEASRIKPTSTRCHSAWSLTRQRLYLSTRRFCSDNRDQLINSAAAWARGWSWVNDTPARQMIGEVATRLLPRKASHLGAGGFGLGRIFGRVRGQIPQAATPADRASAGCARSAGQTAYAIGSMKPTKCQKRCRPVARRSAA